MTISFTYVKESYLFNKKTFIYPGLIESSKQADDLTPIWTIQVTDREASICQGRAGQPVMSSIIEGVHKDLAQFTYQGKLTNGGFDGTRSTWAFIDFDGQRYDWMAGMMQNCWKLEDAQGATIAQYIGMSRDYKIRGTLVLQAKVNEALIALIHLTTKMLRYN
ncbi:hypothetical protein LPJ77_001129 [Coemansia sp. RSA 2523]|nr:hypothetical protein LPJ69_005356 [Coemansia sp. RSA 1752]KAJ1779475.1 hypothetical protein LPJ54_000897 [Coemansia sp. RSA 1824]KAJ1781995.1 hypothetical protein LPJ67_005268 [Coemansia sp. RSA 1938]KAJ1788258.1 hypothetical protein LPJ62_002958 [Coemansia sp. RSA 2167]KAJ1810144.1 hypothetical protein LPJ77_001129 [Coemansia sp. RSA 2523]KAJ2109909.1 hypothetical protein GGF48_005688 [Coemansia sp. RSA 921]KAJ2143125.1 hypothetical protein IW142_003909 [Coemansia sp. RSA 564]KAJ2151462.